MLKRVSLLQIKCSWKKTWFVSKNEIIGTISYILQHKTASNSGISFRKLFPVYFYFAGSNKGSHNANPQTINILTTLIVAHKHDVRAKSINFVVESTMISINWIIYLKKEIINIMRRTFSSQHATADRTSRWKR